MDIATTLLLFSLATSLTNLLWNIAIIMEAENLYFFLDYDKSMIKMLRFRN